MFREFIDDFGGIIGGILIILVIIIGGINICWFRAAKKAKIFNNYFGTTYTISDFYWASDIIEDYIHQGEQKTHNINMDITTDGENTND